MLEAHRDALDRVVATCRREVATWGLELGPIVVDLTIDPDAPRVRTDHRGRIEVVIGGPAHLAPPPEGSNLVYGCCHEVGHVATATATWREHPRPPSPAGGRPR